MADITDLRLGATPLDAKRTEFVVWAPLKERVTIEIVAPRPRRIELVADTRKYFRGTAPVGAGARYFVVGDGGELRPDPASRYQPAGVHDVSEVVSRDFEWHDASWQGRPLPEYIIYEVHIGTFTEQGTFDAAIERLDDLISLGVTALELMPVAQFPGTRNWGYDGVLPFAVQNSYGGPAALKRLIDACHGKGLAVVLDVVYNHLGPEGNYAIEFAPYFTEKYQTPWGPAINVDGEYSDGVRQYFIQNALEWIADYHVDALRLDAVHGILDTSAQPFLAELADAVHARARELGRAVVLIAESDLNDVRMVRPTAQGGMGMDAQWLDDFHHALHALLTGESSGYYADYGGVQHFAEALRQGYVYAGHYSTYRKRRHGNLPEGARPEQFVVCIQNHDQIGNRMLGERIAALVDFERQKLAAACVLLSPYIPLMFMGEEYGERRPFPYFTQHSDRSLVEAIRHGRREEFSAFSWQGEPPDPQAEHTFTTAVVEPATSEQQAQRALQALYRRLIELRRQHGLGPGRQTQRTVIEMREQAVVIMQHGIALVAFSFSERPQEVALALPRGKWRKTLCTADPEWHGPGTQVPEVIAAHAHTRVHATLPATAATLWLSSDEAA